jgi:diadenosine tetraphosphate (Ap4A) HIT family hydrolase
MMSDEVDKQQQAGGEEDTILGKIARGEIPCEFLYQDDQVCTWYKYFCRFLYCEFEAQVCAFQ